MNEREIDDLDREYSLEYQLYNVISSVVEDYEGCKGGLRAPEVWREVMEIEKRLPRAPRPDRFIALERSRLTKDYKRFKQYNSAGDLCWETKEERADRDVERSVNCVLLVLGLRLSSYPDDQENPYEPICERIRKMLMQSDDLELLARLANDLYDTEDEEEAMGYVVPEEDVLKPHIRPVLSKELQAKHDFLKPIVEYYVCVMVSEAGLAPEIKEENFKAIWSDLLMNEEILRELSKPNENLQNTLDDELEENDEAYAVKGNGYNLKLMMNLMGVMLEQKLVKCTITKLRSLLFKDNKDLYFSPKQYKKFGEFQSGFTTEAMYQTVIKIIEEHLSK